MCVQRGPSCASVNSIIFIFHLSFKLSRVVVVVTVAHVVVAYDVDVVFVVFLVVVVNSM